MKDAFEHWEVTVSVRGGQWQWKPFFYRYRAPEQRPELRRLIWVEFAWLCLYVEVVAPRQV